MQTQTQLYTDRSNCARAARRQFGKNAKQGVDFVLVPEAGKFRFAANNEKPEVRMSDLSKIDPRYDATEQRRIPAAEGGNLLATMPADQIPANVPGNSLVAAYVDANPLPQGTAIEANGHARAPDAHPLAHLADQLGIKSTYRTAEAAAIAALGNAARVGTDFFIKKTARGGYVWKSKAYVEAEKELEMSKRKESTTKPSASKARGKVAGKTSGTPPRLNKDKAAALEAAHAGKLPKLPNMSAACYLSIHKERGAELQQIAKDGNVKGLRAYEIKPYNTMMKNLAWFRDLCIVALEARAKGGAATKH